MIKKRYLMILSVAVISVLVGSLLYNSITFAGKPSPQPNQVEVTNFPLDEQGNLRVAFGEKKTFPEILVLRGTAVQLTSTATDVSSEYLLLDDNTRARAFIMIMSQPTSAAPIWDRNPEDFVHGIMLEIDGENYYFAGPGSVEGVTDVPGHTWVQNMEDPYQVVGRHYNVGPPMAAGMPWWATGEPYGVLLFKVHGIVGFPPEDLDAKTEMKLRRQGYVHYHELIDVNTMEEVEDIVVYLKHIAVRRFYFDGGPMPGMAHDVSPGIDFEFMPNW